MSRFPMPRYPDGWFQVAYSDELEAGQVLALKYFGSDLVLFRTEAGEAKLLDAHCPHLGAHLGHGGSVKGDCIECPFHAWQFDGAGACTHVPYAKKIPPKAKLESWPVTEENGMIMTWFHGQGDAPSWDVPSLPEFADDEWIPYIKRRWKVKTHNQEMAENACDSAHFLYLHGTQDFPGTDVETNEHILHMFSKTKMMTPRGDTAGSIEVHAHGFGFTTTRFQGIVDTLLVSSATTIDEDYVDVRFSFTLKKLPSDMATSTVGDAFVSEVTRQLEQDIPIWENKKYIDPPLLCDGDGPIGPYRRWAKQFYSHQDSPADKHLRLAK
jgi:3-ketosteroid 9alpha-monooxygenase subunit A